MITIDLPISFLAGAAFALVSPRRTPGTTPDSSSDTCVSTPGLVFQSLLLTPVIAYFMTRYADWEWHYLFDAHRFFLENVTAFSSLIFCALLAVTILFHIAGYALTARLGRAGKIRAARLPAIVAALATIITPLFFLNQATHVGSFAEYTAGTATPAWFNYEYIMTLAVSGLILGPAFILLSRRHSD